MEMTGLAASRTLEKKEAFHGPPLLWKIALLSPNWTDGCPSSRELPILQWNGLMEMTGLAASHTSEDEAFHVSQVVLKKVACAQKPLTGCKDWLVQPYKTERDHLNIEKLTALFVVMPIHQLIYMDM